MWDLIKMWPENLTFDLWPPKLVYTRMRIKTSANVEKICKTKELE